MLGALECPNQGVAGLLCSCGVEFYLLCVEECLDLAPDVFPVRCVLWCWILSVSGLWRLGVWVCCGLGVAGCRIQLPGVFLGVA